MRLTQIINAGIDMRYARFGLLALLLAMFAAPASRAQEPYPSHVVKIVRPVLPGSTLQ
jgi:hypothetical protein